MDLLPIKRALLSVTDKSDLPEFAAFLAQAGVELISTGGTRKKLLDAGLTVTSVSQVTGFPEILGGRVKTLHPHIHGPLLADKDNPEHMQVIKDMGLTPLDLVCVNLYDFAKAAARNLPLEEAIEEIDIGGPTLLRAAAKNLSSILVVPSPAFYGRVMEDLTANNMAASLGLRREMAAETFKAVSRYDAMIADYLARAGGGQP